MAPSKKKVSPPINEKSILVALRMPLDIDAAVQQAATDDERSKSFIIMRATREWLTKEGYLPLKK